jgi:hypothetical protein
MKFGVSHSQEIIEARREWTGSGISTTGKTPAICRAPGSIFLSQTTGSGIKDDINLDSAQNLLWKFGTSMQEKYTVSHHLAGTLQIDYLTGAVSWNQENIDPLVKSYAKRYLFDEGFIEHALGMLDPAIDNHEIAALLENLSDPGFSS